MGVSDTPDCVEGPVLEIRVPSLYLSRVFSAGCPPWLKPPVHTGYQHAARIMTEKAAVFTNEDCICAVSLFPYSFSLIKSSSTDTIGLQYFSRQ